MWHGVQGYMSMDVGVEVQSGVCGFLRAQELMSRGEGGSCHRHSGQPRSFLLTDVTLTSVGSLFSLQGKAESWVR